MDAKNPVLFLSIFVSQWYDRRFLIFFRASLFEVVVMLLDIFRHLLRPLFQDAQAFSHDVFLLGRLKIVPEGEGLIGQTIVIDVAKSASHIRPCVKQVC